MRQVIFLTDSEAVSSNYNKLKSILKDFVNSDKDGYISDLFADCDYIRTEARQRRGKGFTHIKLKGVSYVISCEEMNSREKNILTAFFKDDKLNSFKTIDNSGWHHYESAIDAIAYRGGSGYNYTLWQNQGPGVKIFDNGGETADRYTVIELSTGDMLGASSDPFHPCGFGQFAGNLVDNTMFHQYGASWRSRCNVKAITREKVAAYISEANAKPDWIGKEIEFNNLPEQVKRYIYQTFEAA